VADSNGQLQPTPLPALGQEMSLSNEEGLLGLAFDPGSPRTVSCTSITTALDSSVHIVRYTASADHPDVIDPTSAETSAFFRIMDASLPG